MERDGQTGGQIHRHTEIERLEGKYTGRQAGRQAGGQLDK